MSETHRLSVSAPAKLNLFLHVGSKRADGYHDLQSLVAFASVGDTLSLEHADGLSLTVEGRFAHQLPKETDNLVLKAARMLAAHAGRPPNAQIALIKHLPVASGIGGGSADAAAALRGLTELWGLDLSCAVLCGLGERLGSDVPVCVQSIPAWMEGRGERISPMADLPIVHLVLVNPGVSVSVADVFASLRQSRGTGIKKPEPFADAEQLVEFLNAASNDLERPACMLAPVINNVLIALAAAGASLARMSGSGATCFGVCESASAAEMAANAIAKTNSEWWVRACRTRALQ